MSVQSDQYQDRVSKIFDRINNIQANVDDERHGKYKLIETILQNFEQNLAEIQQSKQEKFTYLTEKLKQLKNQLEEEAEARSRIESDMQTELSLLERNGKRFIENYQKERIDSDTKLVNNLSIQIEGISAEIQRETTTKMDSLEQYDQYLLEDIPRLHEEIQNEQDHRQEIEQKIFDQFLEQLANLKSSFDDERKDREQKEEELLSILQGISQKIKEGLIRTKQERGKSQDLMIQLVEQMIEKLRSEIYAYDF